MFLINNQRVKHCNKTCWLKKCPDIFCSYNLKAKHLSSLHKGCTLTHRASALTYHSKSKTKITIAINRNHLQQSSCTNSKTTRLPAASWCLSQNLIYRLGSAYLNILCKMHSTIKCTTKWTKNTNKSPTGIFSSIRERCFDLVRISVCVCVVVDENHCSKETHKGCL